MTDLAFNKNPSWLRRRILWIVTGILCALKLAGIGIPLWVCLAPALAVWAAFACAITLAIALSLAVVIGYVIIYLHSLITGEGDFS